MVFGVGKIYVMFGEVYCRLECGIDVVVVVVEIYGCNKIVKLFEGIEMILLCYVEYWGVRFFEFDVEVVL